VLEVDPSTGSVKRIFGSPTGVAGPAAPGTTSDKVLFNRPMGVAVDVDGILTVADSGNNAVRRIELRPSGDKVRETSLGYLSVNIEYHLYVIKSRWHQCICVLFCIELIAECGLRRDGISCRA
jgi:NHL repeat